MDKLMMEISQQAIEKVFSFIKGIGASVTYEDNFDYSKGIKGAEVSYTPETIEELASELELKIISQSYIANLEQQVSDLETALIITKNSRRAHIERYANLDVEKANLEAQNQKLKQALSNVRDRSIKQPVIYNIITKALNDEI